MAKAIDNRDGEGIRTFDDGAPLGQLISMFEWRLPDAADRPDPRARARLERRRSEREARRVAQAARQLAGAIRRGDPDGIDWRQGALADLGIA